MNTQTRIDLPLACDLTALAPGVRTTHREAAIQLLRRDAAEMMELPNGYAFRYLAYQYEHVVQFIANERRCCPFLRFVLEVAPAHGPIWLHITGSEGVKAFMQCELGADDCAS